MNEDMKQDTTKFKATEAKGRPFLKDGVWIFLVLDTSKYYVKVTEDHFKKAVCGDMFEAYHVLAIQGGQRPLFVPPVLATIEPWYCSGNRCSWISLVHPERSKELDEQMEKGLSVIETATAADVPPIKGKLHLA